MKKLEDIERLSFEELEGIADDRRIEVPVDLKDCIGAALADDALRKYRPSGRKHLALPVSLSVLCTALAAMALFLVLHTSQVPKDTFDDPMLAYAELEKTFSYISGKVNRGAEIALDAAPAVGKSGEIIEKINRK